MSNVLIVEDSAFFSSALERALSNYPDIQTFRCATLKEAKAKITGFSGELSLALVDLNLPDARNFDAVRLVAAYNIPAIVFSGELDKEKRDELFQMGVIDSVPKDSPSSLDYAVKLVTRILKNRFLSAMVVEDSDTVRSHAIRLLNRQGLEVIEAQNGEDALKLLEHREDIRLILTDYAMPVMDGFDLIRKVRQKHPSTAMAVIGMSAVDDPDLSVKFIKSGANDFLHKPFVYEELLCRVSQNLDMLEHIERFEHMATRDFLTDLHNRRYLFDVGKTMFANAQRKSLDFTVGIMDIDHFKKVNDTYGHDVGDLVLKLVAKTLQDEYREADVVARLGGEEFCVISMDMNPEKAVEVFDRARQTLAKNSVDADGNVVSVTMSTGVCNHRLETFEQMVSAADAALYEAKEGGRNRVVCSSTFAGA